MYPGYNIITTEISYIGGYESPIRTLVNVFGFGLWAVVIAIWGVITFIQK